MDVAELPRVPGLTLLRCLGEGSTGTVYAARRDADGWSCAVKIAADLDPQIRADLVQEATVLGSVRLPHLIALHEVLETTDGRVALLLDLADGGTVHQVVAQRGRLSPAEAVTVLTAVLRTLAELHRRGIVHGDVSASNVLLTRDSRPMLIDLGRARLVGQRTAVGGTAEFLAPEVDALRPPTAAADVYAAAALGWRMLTGEAVPAGLLRRPLGEVLPGCPAALGFVIDDCLRGEPQARPSAERAAEAVLTACAAAPLVLPDGSDPGEQLTFRLREGRARAPYRPAVGGGGRASSTGRDPVRTPRARAGQGRQRAGRGRTGPHRGRRERRSEPAARHSGRHRRVAARPAESRWWSRAAALTTGAAGFAVVTAAVLWFGGPLLEATVSQAGTTVDAGAESDPGIEPTRTPPAPPGPVTPTASRPVTVPPPASQPVTAGPTSTGPTPPTSRPSRQAPGGVDPAVAELAALVDARAQAFREADPAYLDRVYPSGSAAATTDRVDVAELRRAGVRYEGLRYAIVDPVIESCGPNECRIRVRLDIGGYVVRRNDQGPTRGAGGGTGGGTRPVERTVAATRGSPMRVQLVRTPQGWRIAAVQAA